MQTTHRQIDPADHVRSASRYSQAIETAPGRRYLHLSGQIGLAPDGTLAGTPRGQHEQCFANVLRLLAAAGMGREHLVRLNAYLVGTEQVALYREVRDEVLGDARPASTVVLVAGLARPEWLVEIEAVAAL
jgi:2-iminobutanoate/2-iminopropanoate deaminase